MTEFFRFRSIDALLGEYQELEKQTIYFPSPEELNDPMEGFRDIVWSGDKIVWTNLFKHYVFCLHRSYCLFRIAGDSVKLDVDSIPILGRWDEPPTPQEQNLFDEIWHKFLNLPNIQEVIEALANTKHKIRYREIGCYLRGIHFVLLDEIQKSHIAHGLMSESQIPQPLKELTAAALMERLLNSIELTEAVKDEQQLDAIFQIIETRYDAIMLTVQCNTRTIFPGIVRNNNLLVICDFSKVYVEQLEKLLWSKWYTVCFTKSHHNSSVWAKYGESHKGACLIFEAVATDSLNSLELNQTTGSGFRTMPFYEISYADRPGEVDFFRTICRLPVAALMKLWYIDQDGNISECASHIGPGGDEGAWRKSYWDNFFRDITIKTRDWAYEQEYRLILADGLSEFDEKKDRTLTYNFNSLKGIIFGINTSIEDKMRIIEIIQRKCGENNRADFKFFQAHYSAENGEIRKYEISLR